MLLTVAIAVTVQATFKTGIMLVSVNDEERLYPFIADQKLAVVSSLSEKAVLNLLW